MHVPSLPDDLAELRDRFACYAVSGFTVGEPEDRAIAAYEVADAMLALRASVRLETLEALREVYPGLIH